MLGATLGGMLAGMIIPGIGAIFGALISLINKPPDPSASFKTIMTFYYDTLNEAFNQTTQTTILKVVGMKKSKVMDIAQKHHAIIDAEGKRFVEVLNLFPQAVHGAMVDTLDRANELLDMSFARKKYSKGGKRSIEKELEDLKNIDAPRSVFHSLSETIGVGFSETLKLLNLQQAAEAARRGFSYSNTGMVDIPLGSPEETQKFVDALKQLITFTGSLTDISSRGLQPFLTRADMGQLEGEFANVFSQSGTGFTTAVADMIERVKPLTEFIRQSIQQSNDLLGRGIMAALEAATESEAQTKFIETLGSGVKDVIFQGITSAFIASAQFGELLAPIQKTIREFTQQAVSTGKLPDLGAFRSAILPSVEGISTRAETLAPLISELQKLGFEIRDKLGLVTEQPKQPAQNNITINIGTVNDEADARTLAEELGRHISGFLAPAE
jgi:hypothetical protein